MAIAKFTIGKQSSSRYFINYFTQASESHAGCISTLQLPDRRN